MGLTKDQLYDLYDGSIEHKLTDKLDKDVFGIRGLLPEQALEQLTDGKITTTINELVQTIIKADNGNLGLRQDVLSLGLTDRYLGLRKQLQDMGNHIEKSIQQYIMKMLSYTPRPFVLLSINTKCDYPDETRVKQEQYFNDLHNCLMTSVEDKIEVETLYFAYNMVNAHDEGLTLFFEQLGELIKKTHIFDDYLLQELYFNPDNLNTMVLNDIQNDVRWVKVREFPSDEYMISGIEGYNHLYHAYLELAKPVRESKALTSLKTDEDLLNIVNSNEQFLSTFNNSSYIYHNQTVFMYRDGLTIVEQNGEFEHIPSSKVTKKDKERVYKRLTETA